MALILQANARKKTNKDGNNRETLGVSCFGRARVDGGKVHAFCVEIADLMPKNVTKTAINQTERTTSAIWRMSARLKVTRYLQGCRTWKWCSAFQLDCRKLKPTSKAYWTGYFDKPKILLQYVWRLNLFSIRGYLCKVISLNYSSQGAQCYKPSSKSSLKSG